MSMQQKMVDSGRQFLPKDCPEVNYYPYPAGPREEDEQFILLWDCEKDMLWFLLQWG